jgi:hypothetical protein
MRPSFSSRPEAAPNARHRDGDETQIADSRLRKPDFTNDLRRLALQRRLPDDALRIVAKGEKEDGVSSLMTGV